MSFPYLAEADLATETVMQKWWDTMSRTTPNLKVFLAGSHISWMREHTLSEHGPLQNRHTRQIEVLPLDYRHAAEFYPDWPSQDKIRAYAIWGGLPGYVREIHPTLGLWDNVSQTILDPNARLCVEPDWLRFTDLRADRLYTSLVRAMAIGQSTSGDIAKEVGRHSAADIFDPLNRLVDLSIVIRVHTLTTRAERRSRSHYHLADPFLAFWYRFIDSRRSMLRRGQIPLALAQIKEEIDDHISHYIFEDICRLHTLPFVKRGRADQWLTSEVFGLTEPRSRDAEQAIEKAKALQLMEHPPKEEVQEISEWLKKVLAPDDKFWPLWTYFAKQQGNETG